MEFDAWCVVGIECPAMEVVSSQGYAEGVARSKRVNWHKPNATAVPCIITPLLTADEREKLIGGEG